jgi:L-lysine 2,3-aminomutase
MAKVTAKLSRLFSSMRTLCMESVERPWPSSSPPITILSLIDWSDPLHDPLVRQYIPLGSRLRPDHPKVTLDSIDETGDSPAPGIIHRYRDRAVFLGRSVPFPQICSTN